MKLFFLLILFVIAGPVFGQSIIDSCFQSATPGTGFVSSANLANAGDADLLQWNGTSWTGGFSLANITIPPPTNNIGCRAVFIGNGVTWTTGGEFFSIKLSSGLVAGQTYSFPITYVSHGFGSTGSFSPQFSTNSIPSALGGATVVGFLPAVGFSWTTNTITFTATAAQTGHTWISLFSTATGSSGLINSFCSTCTNTPCSFSLGPDLTLCNGNTATLTANLAGATYVWQDGSTNASFTVSSPGTYFVTATSGSCVVSDTVVVSNSNPSTSFLGNDTTICEGQLLTINATTPNSTYLWQDGSTNPTISVSDSGSYNVQVSTNGCVSHDTIHVAVTPLPLVFLGNDTTICPNLPLVLDVTLPGATYLWQDNSTLPTFSVTQAGVYFVQVTVNGCDNASVVTVSTFQPLTLNIGNDTVLCDGQTIVLDATSNAPNVSYLWHNNTTNPTITTASAVNIVTISNQCGSLSDTLLITNNLSPQVNLGEDLVICEDSSVLLSVPFSSGVLWSTNSTNNLIEVHTPGLYFVAVTNSCGTAMDSVWVTGKNCECPYFIPNAFTPDNDEFNATFGPVSDCEISSFLFQIYNRWGELVFESADMDVKWDGTYGNSSVPTGVYTYSMRLQPNDGELIISRGHVVVL